MQRRHPKPGVSWIESSTSSTSDLSKHAWYQRGRGRRKHPWDEEVHTDLLWLIDDEHYRNRFHHLMSHYQLRADLSSASAALVHVVSRNSVVAGEIVGILGQLLLLESPETGVVASDISSLNGYVMRLANNIDEFPGGLPRVEGGKALLI